jgi:hypothetical protein
MLQIAQVNPSHRVLEPSAGSGDLATAIALVGVNFIDCFEIHPLRLNSLGITLDPALKTTIKQCGQSVKIDVIGDRFPLVQSRLPKSISFIQLIARANPRLVLAILPLRSPLWELILLTVLRFTLCFKQL